MPHIAEGRLHAYLDSAAALNEEERIACEAHLAVCEDCRDRLADAGRVRDAASAILDRAQPERIARPPFAEIAARAAEPGGEEAPEVRELDTIRRPAAIRAPRPWGRMRSLAWAASLVVALGAGWIAHEVLRGPRMALSPAAEQDMREIIARDAVDERFSLEEAAEPSRGAREAGRQNELRVADSPTFADGAEDGRRAPEGAPESEVGTLARKSAPSPAEAEAPAADEYRVLSQEDRVDAARAREQQTEREGADAAAVGEGGVTTRLSALGLAFGSDLLGCYQLDAKGVLGNARPLRLELTTVPSASEAADPRFRVRLRGAEEGIPPEATWIPMGKDSASIFWGSGSGERILRVGAEAGSLRGLSVTAAGAEKRAEAKADARPEPVILRPVPCDS